MNPPSIAAQDKTIPSCHRQCQTCQGSRMNHHWMIGTDDSESDDAQLILICRHCSARIENFDVSDPNMPDV